MIDRAGRSVCRYEAKLRLGACGSLPEEEIQRRVERYASRAYQNEATHLQVRQVLNCRGVRPMSDLMYHAYACELGKLKRLDCSPETRDSLLRASVEKWTARGLSVPALKEVAECVFNLYLPASPEA